MDQDWFDGKARQVTVGSICAFGVELESSHDRAQELAELLLFAQALAAGGVAWAVARAVYNSKSCRCDIHLATPAPLHAPHALAVKRAAEQHLRYFNWGDSVHGASADSDEGPLPF